MLQSFQLFFLRGPKYSGPERTNTTEVLIDQLRKWQANSKRIIANMCLQYHLSHVIKTHISDESSASFKRVSVQSFTCFGFCHFCTSSVT